MEHVARGRRMDRWTVGASVFALVAVALFAVVKTGPAGDDVGAGGVVGFEVHKKGRGGAGDDVVVHTGATVASNDELAFVVVGARGKIASVVDVDGTGVSGTLVPPTRVERSRAELPGAMKLDEDGDVEHLTLFVCDAELPTSVLEAAAVAAATKASPPPAGCAMLTRDLWHQR